MRLRLTRRAALPVQRRKNKLPLGPIAIGFFLFVVIGSSLLQVINTASK